MAFWPSGGKLGREPDVVLKIGTREGHEYGLCVEAKYLSGKSGLSGGIEDVNQGAEAVSPGDQLAAQWMQICEQTPPRTYLWGEDLPLGNRALLFVTAHAALPREELKESLQIAQDDNAWDRCFWLGWSQLHQVLESYVDPHDRSPSGPGLVLVHLRALLERKGLRFFRGYADCLAELSDSLNWWLHAAFWNESFFDYMDDESEIAIDTPVFWSQDNG